MNDLVPGGTEFRVTLGRNCLAADVRSSRLFALRNEVLKGLMSRPKPPLSDWSESDLSLIGRSNLPLLG
jgi:hypothetical protein